MKKPIIGILGGLVNELMPNYEILQRVATPSAYFESVEKAGGVPIMLPITKYNEIIECQISLCDGFIFTGGMDINPIMYNEEPHKNLETYSVALDRYQYGLIRRVVENTKKPFLAICRGFQMLNIVKGGTLHQDLIELESSLQHVQKGLSCDPGHSISVKEGSTLYDVLGEYYYVNTYHHQFIKELGKDLVVTARAKDDIIEAVELNDRKFAVGVQWHPESMALCDDNMLKLFELLVENSKAQYQQI